MILHASALSAYVKSVHIFARSAHYRLDAFRRVFSNRTYAAVCKKAFDRGNTIVKTNRNHSALYMTDEAHLSICFTSPERALPSGCIPTVCEKRFGNT
uniref:Uncharacterized protein n=1 Tax=Peronospora matthiolae TaxID=2874970 RepID=A0AAV1U9X5_9STRA